MRRLQQRSKTPTLVREEEELSEKATLSDPSSASRRPKTGLNRLLRNPASSHDVIAAGELAPFSVDMWSADKPLHRSDDFSIHSLAQSIMTQITVNPKDGLPAPFSPQVARIIESHGRLSKELESARSQLEAEKEERTKLQSETASQQAEIEHLKGLLATHDDNDNVRSCSSSPIRHSMQTVDEFLSDSTPSNLKIFSPEKLQKVSAHNTPRRLLPSCSTAPSYSRLEPKDSALSRISSSDSSTKVSRIAQKAAKTAHASRNHDRTRKPNAALNETHCSHRGFQSSARTVSGSSTPQDPRAEGLIPNSPSSSITRARQRAPSINSVATSQSRIPSPAYRSTNQAHARRERSNSSLSTIRRISPRLSQASPRILDNQEGEHSSSGGNTDQDDQAKVAARIASSRYS